MLMVNISCIFKAKVIHRITLYRWLDKNPTLMSRFVHKQIPWSSCTEECLEIIDTPPPLIGEGENARYDNAIVNWNAKRADIRLLLAKWYPQEYSEKLIGLRLRY